MQTRNALGLDTPLTTPKQTNTNELLTIETSNTRETNKNKNTGPQGANNKTIHVCYKTGNT